MSEKMTWNELRTVILSASGSALEYYDFTIFVFLAFVISDVFFPADSPELVRLLQTYTIFALGYLVRPIGGIVIAHFGDKIGRKRMFMFSLLLMAIPTFCIGLLPTYKQVGWVAPALLLLLRITQGFALAGEMPGAIVFVSEHANSRRVSVSCSILLGIVFLGLALGSSTSGLLTEFLPNREDLYSYGWRLPFIVGGVFGFISVYLRRYLQETPLFVKLREAKVASAKLPLMDVLRNHLPACLYVAALAFFLNQTTIVLFQFMPTLLLKQFGLPPRMVFWANTSAILCYAAACLAWGLLGDRIGRGYAMCIGAISTALAVIWMIGNLDQVGHGQANLYVMWGVVGIAAGYVGLIASMAASAFPTSVRLTGFSFPYNLAATLSGGLTPIILTWLLSLDRTAPVYLAIVPCAGFGALGLIYLHMRHYLKDPMSEQIPSIAAEHINRSLG
jgi:MFS family permease